MEATSGTAREITAKSSCIHLLWDFKVGQRGQDALTSPNLERLNLVRSDESRCGTIGEAAMTHQYIAEAFCKGVGMNSHHLHRSGPDLWCLGRHGCAHSEVIEDKRLHLEC